MTLNFILVLFDFILIQLLFLISFLSSQLKLNVWISSLDHFHDPVFRQSGFIVELLTKTTLDALFLDRAIRFLSFRFSYFSF